MPGRMPHMYVSHFWGEELLDSGLLGRGKIQEKLQEYIPLYSAKHKLARNKAECLLNCGSNENPGMGCNIGVALF